MTMENLLSDLNNNQDKPKLTGQEQRDAKDALMLKRAEKMYQNYFDWWSPIDIACGSCSQPVDNLTFYIRAMTKGDEFFDRFFESEPEDKERTKENFRRFLLNVIIRDNGPRRITIF